MAKQPIDWKEIIEGNQLILKDLGRKLLLTSSEEKREELKQQIGELKNQEHISVLSAYASEGTDKLNEEMRKLEERYRSYDLSHRHMFKTETTVTKEKSKNIFNSDVFTAERGLVKDMEKGNTIRSGVIFNVHNTLNYDRVYYYDNHGKRSKPFIQYWNTVDESILKEFRPIIGNYKSPHGYMPWDWVINRMIVECKSHNSENIVHELKTTGKLNTLGESFLFMSTFLTINPSPVFLTQEIIKAFLKTDIKGFKASPNEVLPYYTLMLPKNTLGAVHDSDDGEIEENYYTLLVMTNRARIEGINNYLNSKECVLDKETSNAFRKLIDPDNYLPGEYGSNQFKPGFKVFALNDKAGYTTFDFIWEEGTEKWQIISKYDIEGYKELNSDEVISKYPGDKNHASKTLKAVNNFAKAVLNIVANSILLMSYEPEYVTVQSPQVVRGFGKSKEDKAKQATWLGEHYKQPKVKYEYPEDHVPKKGKSPRSHWRRGHMRKILQGPGRKQVTFKWIKPVFIVGRGIV